MTQTVLLGDEIELAYGKGLPQRVRVAGKFPVFGSNGQVDTHNAALVSGPGIIVGRKGSVGEVIWSEQDYWPIDTTYYVKPKNHGDNLRYWYYQLKTLGLEQLNSHSAIPGLNRDVAYAKPVIKRDPKEQDEIAYILGTIDEKIELNRRLNETLEQIGQTLFKHYFIDNPEVKTWQKGKITDLGTVITGKTPSKTRAEYFGGDLLFLKVPDMHGQSIVIKTGDSLTKEGAVSQKDKTVPKYSTCISCIATVGLVSLAGSDLQTNQQINSIVPARREYRFYNYSLMRENSDLIKSMASGGTATPNLNKGQFKAIPVVVPPSNQLQEFDALVLGTFQKIEENMRENENLIKLRDSLLPRLISGKIILDN